MVEISDIKYGICLDVCSQIRIQETEELIFTVEQRIREMFYFQKENIKEHLGIYLQYALNKCFEEVLFTLTKLC